MTKTISGEVRMMVLKVMKYFEREKENKKPLLPVHQAMQRAAIATGFSRKTLWRIKAEANKIADSLKSDKPEESENPEKENEEKTEKKNSQEKSENSEKTENSENTEDPDNPENKKKKRKKIKKLKTPENLSEIKLTTPGLHRRPKSSKFALNSAQLEQLHHIMVSCTVSQTPNFKKVFELAQRDLNFRGKMGSLRRIMIDKLGYKPNQGKDVEKVPKATKGAKRKEKLAKQQLPLARTMQMSNQMKNDSLQPHNVSMSFPGYHFMAPMNPELTHTKEPDRYMKLQHQTSVQHGVSAQHGILDPSYPPPQPMQPAPSTSYHMGRLIKEYEY